MEQNNYYQTKKRLLSLLVAAIFIFFVIFCRLAYIQVSWGKQLQIQATDQWTRDIPLEAKRGNIYDSTGKVLATSVGTFDIYVRPKSVKDKDVVSKQLSDLLSMDYTEIYQKVAKTNASEVTIAKQVSADIANQIRQLNISGVYLGSQYERQYVYGDFLSQVLGYVSIDNLGQSGIEAYYDKYLAGTDGTILTETDLVGSELEDTPMHYIAATDGFDVVLTIDFVIQSIVENVLELAMQQYQAKSARCIVLDVNTGDILAMSSKPSVNLNELPRDDVTELARLTKNTLLTDVYEPGSTFKVLTAAASLEEYSKGNPNAFGANYVFTNNSRSRVIDGSTIKCWSTHANGKHSNQTLSNALNNSCNPIFTDIALSLGKEVMYDYLESFGYGSITGIDYRGEQSGILVGESVVTRSDLARIGFGQTIAVTALQLAMATAAAVNGGYLLQPNLVDRIIDPLTGLTVYSSPTIVKSQPISQQTSKQIATMLQDVVTNGSGKQAYIEGYNVGGKTGTAQKFSNGVIDIGKYVSSFVGFFPANNPQYLALVIVDEPVGQSYGSVVAAPFAKMIFSEIINYKNIPKQS